MKLRAALLLTIFAALNATESWGQAAAADKTAAANPAKKPGLTQRLLKPWTFFKGKGEAGKQSAVNWKQLALTVSAEPAAIKLRATRQVKVTLHLRNEGKRLEQLEFPTTQRIEVLIKSSEGKVVEQWSEDQSFANEPTLVAINPKERLEYTVSLSTRDLVGGQAYSIEAFFPQYEQLKAVTTVTAEK